MAAMAGCHSVTCGPPHAAAGRLAAGTNGSLQRVQRQSGNADAVQVRLGRGAGVVVVGVAETVQRRGEDVVELVEVARGQQLARDRTGPGAASSLRKRLGLHAAQEHGGVDQPVEAAPDGDGRRRPGRAASRPMPPPRPARAASSPASPAQRISALPPSDTPTATSGPPCCSRRRGQDPADLFVVARVVGPRPLVELAAAAAKMRHHVGQSAFARRSRRRLRRSGCARSPPGRGRAPASGALLRSVRAQANRDRRSRRRAWSSARGGNCGWSPNTRRAYSAGQIVCRLPPGNHQGAS